MASRAARSESTEIFQKKYVCLAWLKIYQIKRIVAQPTPTFKFFESDWVGRNRLLIIMSESDLEFHRIYIL